MTQKEFKDKVLQVTRKAIDKLPSDWITFNDKLNTRIVSEKLPASQVNLLEDELPILECDLEKSYLLITTKRICSIIEGGYDDLVFEDMDKFLSDYVSENKRIINGFYPKTNKHAIRKKDGSKLIFCIDSYEPAYFTNILIRNILSYKRSNKWYLNPSQKYKNKQS